MPEVTLWQLDEPFWPAPRGVRTSPAPRVHTERNSRPQTDRPSVLRWPMTR